MQLPLTLLTTIIPLATAIDVRFYKTGTHCVGSHLIYSNLPAGTCCSTGNNQHASVGYANVRSNQHISATGFTGGGCVGPTWLAELRGDTSVCMTPAGRRGYTGSRYELLKRVKGRAVGDLGSEGNCTETVKPDTLVLADGVTEYDISGLEDDKVASLVAIAETGAGPEAIPKEFSARPSISPSSKARAMPRVRVKTLCAPLDDTPQTPFVMAVAPRDSYLGEARG
ncbi:uncharacterized protein CTHT_0013180 [Thermochaetoides thermophila DSM 1495]|uniref:Uncharacterized protein n=1 Tax=Chaetomium thermophilum (strain DSM 1495 / CBS 144.50 / IMI 039719) TaxID=759272 RepID=G0S1D2_CHATD|nr:hypothetical protein CTHT_0013180 [Thermochaetoides thermophila DSM 1495]EGS22842.1 hypothetical protein CTHT_0013180 [Thermochaetoides thermophila DSM 1495]